jgi:hypothetical protein
LPLWPYTLIERARVYDHLSEEFFNWAPELANHYRRWAGPHRNKGYDELTDYDGPEPLG